MDDYGKLQNYDTPNFHAESNHGLVFSIWSMIFPANNFS